MMMHAENIKTFLLHRVANTIKHYTSFENSNAIRVVRVTVHHYTYTTAIWERGRPA